MSANKECDDRLSGIGCGVTCPALLRGTCEDPPVEDLVEEIKRQGNVIATLETKLATAQKALAERSPFFKAEDRPYDEGRG